jgi:hypothetical protein
VSNSKVVGVLASVEACSIFVLEGINALLVDHLEPEAYTSVGNRVLSANGSLVAEGFPFSVVLICNFTPKVELIDSKNTSTFVMKTP